MNVVIIGAGNGGVSAAVELVLKGHKVVLYGRSASTIEPYRDGIAYQGVFGSGTVKPERITTDMVSVIADADVAVVTLPTFAHAPVAQQMARSGWAADKPIILNPGHTGGTLEFERAYQEISQKVPPIAEFSTLTYVARKHGGNIVDITGRAKRVRAAALPGGTAALQMACELFTGAYNTGDVLASGLANVNMILHPPGAILSASWVEAKGGDYTFYVEGMTAGTARVMHALDMERLAVARSFGHELPNLIQEMKALGTVSEDASDKDYASAIAGGEANRRIRGPDSFRHRYYIEDFNYGLTPFLALARIAGVPVPVAESLSQLGRLLIEDDRSRDASAMGIDHCTKRQLLERVGSRVDVLISDPMA